MQCHSRTLVQCMTGPALLSCPWLGVLFSVHLTFAPHSISNIQYHLKPDLHPQQFSSVTQSCPVLCDPKDCSTPGLPIHHQLPEFAQTHVHHVGDAIQPSSSSVVPFSSRLQSFPASGSFQMSQLFTSGGQLLDFQLQHQSFQ